jgi:hypothetical protein
VERIRVPKVDRNGLVTLNGESVGWVERIHEETLYSYISGGKGPARWAPKDREGNPLPGPWRTRRDAVDVVIKASAGIEINSVELKNSHCSPPHDTIWVADIGVNGNYFGVSRFPGEEHWFSFYEHTLGAIIPRLSTMAEVRPARALVHAGAIAALNAAAREKGAAFND